MKSKGPDGTTAVETTRQVTDEGGPSLRNRLTCFVFSLLLCIGTPLRSAARPGSIAGVIRYTGAVPPPEEISTTDGSTLLHSNLVVEPKTKGLRYVSANLEGTPSPPKFAQLDPVVVDQRDMVFLPRVVAVRRGQTVRFENNDAFNHSITAVSAVAANEFNLFVPPGNPYEHKFESQKSPVPIGCTLHPWMRVWVYVFSHPWFAVSDAHGRFRIDQVPPGKYTIWLRHPDTGNQERREIEVRDGQTVELAIEWKRVDKK